MGIDFTNVGSDDVNALKDFLESFASDTVIPNSLNEAMDNLLKVETLKK